MKQIPNTLLIFLKQEWITVAVYLVATILFLLIIFAGGHYASPDDRRGHQFVTILLISMLSIFVGLYLGSGFLRLKQSYLWRSLPHYKNNLVASFVIAATLYGLIQLVAMRFSGWSWSISLLAPIAMTILAAQAVIANNLIMKFILPTSPFILFQLTHLDIGPLWVLMLLLVLASLALYLNYTNERIENESSLGLMSGNLEKQLKNSGIQKINNLVNDLFSKLGFKNLSKDLSVALMRPNNRFGITSLTMSLIALFFFHSMGKEKVEVEGLAAFMMASLLLSVFIELKMLAKQCKPFAHLYSANAHWDFKHRILFMLQKYMLIQAIIFITSLTILDFIIGDFTDISLVARYVFSVTLVAIIFLPAFLCLNWFSVNFKLLGVVIAYIGLAIVLCGWFYHQQSLWIFLGQLIATIIVLVIVQLSAKAWWRHQPIEQFMRTHG